MRALALLFLIACGPPAEPHTPTPPAPPTAIPVPVPLRAGFALGLPVGHHDVVLDRGSFVLGFDEELHVARWAAWKLEKSDLGKASRSERFHPDPNEPFVQDSDYLHSGFDRGHLCPSADRTATPEANLATFVLSNVQPQLHELNAGPWEELEKKERDLVREGRSLYIVAGGLFDASPKRIGRGVAVPRASFKVIVAALDPGAVRADTPTLAVVMPNEKSVKLEPYTAFVTTIRSVEESSGYDLDSLVPREIQDALETHQGWVEPPSARHVSSRPFAASASAQMD